MRKVLAFLVWLFSFWTWKDFFVRWLRRSPLSPANGETVGSEHLPSQERHPESEWARFLSSLPEDERRCGTVVIDGDYAVVLVFGPNRKRYRPAMPAGYGEFLGAVASSEVVFDEFVAIRLRGNKSLKFMEAFADSLRRSGKAFRKLRVSSLGVSAIPFAKCISSALLGNDAIEVFYLSFCDEIAKKTGNEVAVEFMGNLGVPHILRILHSFTFNCYSWGNEGLEQLLKPFNSLDSALEKLEVESLSSNAQLEHIGGLLVASTSLNALSLDLSYDVEENLLRGCSSMASALCSNHSLQSLRVKGFHRKGLKTLLDPLMLKTNNIQPNTTLTHLELFRNVGGKEGIETLVDMLRTNTSLLSLTLSDLKELSSENAQAIENVLAILEALKANKSVKKIGFERCLAVGGYKVLGAMMDLLLENHCIEDIDLSDTPLKRSGDAEYVYSALSKRKKMKLWSIVQGMANVKPTSGRVFLCGHPFAGKTRLRLSMQQLKEFQQKEEAQITSGLGNKMRRAFKRTKNPTVLKEDMLLERTQGIEVDNVLCEDICISIWDMAGQTDYHSFHELVMPNFSADGSCSIFLLMCDPMERFRPLTRCSLSSVKTELESWLRFIASNTRRSNSYRPHVSIVMTHFDYWKNDGLFATRIKEEVTKLKAQFQEVLEFDVDNNIFKVDGRDVSDARTVFDFIKSYLKQLLERLPKTISACAEVQQLLVEWNEDKSKPLLLKWEEFCESMCKDVEDFSIVNQELAKRRKEFVALALSDGGHIIYDEKEGVVITNPHWFCHHIMGQFLYQCSNEGFQLDMVSPNGVISVEHVKLFILGLLSKEGDIDKKFDDILCMMKKLHICCEQDEKHILIPSTLRDTKETLSWFQIDGSRSFKYVGRRLACQDGQKTMLTVGFFTRLQVSFFQTLQSKSDQHTYKIFRDVIKFINVGIEVILQFNDGDIDIFARSDQSQYEMLAFLEIHIIDHIKRLQKDSTLGCSGVRLIEYILRPECVQKLLSPIDYKTQAVHVKDLEVEVIKYGANAKYNWGACEGLDVGSHSVKTLLGDVAYHNLLMERTRKLHEYHKRIQSLDSSTQNDPSLQVKNDDENLVNDDVSTTFRWQMPWDRLYVALDVRLKNFEGNLIKLQKQHHEEIVSKLDHVVEMIQSLEHDIKDMQKELLHKVCSRIDDLMAFSVEMKSSKIPKVAYLSEVGNQKLLMRFVPGLDSIKLHLMCESIHGFHQVANQEGCVVHFGTKDTKRFLAMLAYGLKVVTILTKIGAHVACGMGAMVPDFGDGFTFLALILDTPGLLDYRMPTVTLESLPIEAKKVSRLSTDDTSEAQRWLRTFLEPKCENKREFSETFKLTKVKYESSGRGSIAWICDQCLSKQSDAKVVLN